MSLNTQKEVVNWKLEARLEDAERYFFPVNRLETVTEGRAFYVIGRKGSGKTAVSQHLYQSRAYDCYTQRFTFKNFPFNDLYKLSNQSYRQPNQYITLWKYLIYSAVAKMMATNERIDPEIRSQLGRIYNDDPQVSLPRMVARWTASDFDFKVMGTGIKSGEQSTINENATPWIERVSILEELIVRYIDDSRYLLVFDELDEDYGAGAAAPDQEYWQLLVSLFKAVQDVRSVFAGTGARIFPTVFLREDIYSQLQDADKTKWQDVVYWLEWTPDRIKDLISFRISRAHDPDGDILGFEEAWSILFTNQLVSYGASRNKRSLSSFDYITRAGCWRPRDYIRYMKATAQIAVEKQISPVPPKLVVQALKEFSNYLRSEMEDEIGGILPNIRLILDSVAHIRKPIFKLEDFINSCPETAGHNSQVYDAEGVLRVLYGFSVIGNFTRQQKLVFNYTNREARLNLLEPFAVHPGLLRAFQIP